MVVFGGGYVGLELAQAFARFGSRVTVVERGTQLVAKEDKDVADAILGYLREDGLDVQLNTVAAKVEGTHQATASGCTVLQSPELDM